MTDILEIDIPGIDRLIAKFSGLAAAIESNLRPAGEEAAAEILDTQGLRRYPPMTAANAAPTPYYVRGRGTQLKNRNLNNSERYGTQWTVTNQPYTTTVSNRASYAPYLAGSRQALAMARIGWRKLHDVAAEKRDVIRGIYVAWVNRAIREFRR